MATRTLPDRKSSAGAPSARLTPEQLVAAYRTMLLSRRLDDKEVQLKGQNKIFFQISGAGHEGVLTAAGMIFKPAYDWFYTYYRDRALCLSLGVTPAEMLYEAVGAAVDPASGGRQMPSHWGHKAYNIVSASSPTGTQFLQGVGSAEATLRAKLLNVTEGFREDEVVFISTGEGQTSEGEFWESLNTASNLKLPAVYLVEDNGYAISVPVEVNTTGGSISKLVRSVPDLLVEEVDAVVLAATDDALAQPQPGPETVYFGVYSPDVDPTSERFDTEDDPQFSGDPTTMVDLLNACMKDEMRRDKKILVFGQDVADV